MKNKIKLGLAIAAIATFTACKGASSTTTTDTTKVTDSTKTTVVDTVKMDTNKMKMDTGKKM